MLKAKPKLKVKFCELQNGVLLEVLYSDPRLNSVYDPIISEKMLYAFHVDKSSPEQDQVSHYTDGYICIPVNPKFNFTTLAVTDTMREWELNPKQLIEDIIVDLEYMARGWDGWKDEPAIEPVVTRYEGGVTYVEV